ncbi:GNAT family N-acetyltransferase, partial [bacterium]|nr:GNAT family N-acetyltransferase [bacterium]
MNFTGLEISCDGRLISLIPMWKGKDNVFSPLGDPDLFDHRGFICFPGFEMPVCLKLIEWLRGRAFKFGPLPSENILYMTFLDAAKRSNLRLIEEVDDVSPGIVLPATFTKFLSNLPAKERHELRRKMRGISEGFSIQTVENDSDPKFFQKMIDLFIVLLRESSLKKEAFLTHQRESFFKTLAKGLADEGSLIVDIIFSGNSSIAGLFGFVHGKTYFLYNSGLNQKF